MPNMTVKALDVKKPGNSLAAWLAMHHPDLFLSVFKKAQQAQVAKGVARLGRLAHLGEDGITTTFDTPALTDITFDPSTVTLSDSLISPATDSGASFLSSIGNSFTSAGSTVGGVLSSAGSGVLDALGSVGSYLTSGAGLTSLTNLAKSYYTAQAANSNAQTQQAVLNAQIGRATTGSPVAPITYRTNAQGQLVPVYATPTANGTVYSPLSSAGIAALTPSTFTVFLSKYGVWIAAAGLGVVALSKLARG